MYIFPVGNQNYLYDRDIKRVGSYMKHERVPGVNRVSYDVRHIKITKIDSNIEIDKPLSRANADKKNVFSEDWLGQKVDLRV
jgi:hypothetical protein